MATKLTPARALKAAQRAAFRQGFKDAINARAPAHEHLPPHLLGYYNAGHHEGWPKRLVPTTIVTARGPLVERCTLERAAFLLATNSRTPGARRDRA